MDPYILPLNKGIFELFWNLGLFAKIIVIVLIIFSIISWAIIIKKYFDYKKIKKSNNALKTIFNSRSNITDLFDIVKEFPDSLLAKITIAAEKEYRQSINNNCFSGSELSMINITESMSKEITLVLERLEENLGFLATSGSVAPFLGLLGTVWGILSAFLNVRHVPIVTLQTIAPGIADALVTTVVGLLVAIPAVIAYNYFIGQIKKFSAEMENWQIEIITNLRRELLIKSKSKTSNFENSRITSYHGEK
ncbi:MAG: MotA/TolQ/ExbB proton channel family protein [candidate division WOR-3 bacterium]|nr:MotA/TolQ/ExbB proton channel family protein [candidate division WOR-3 bacterium]MCX7757475.1 MotA/TolQ/ExbB proton channel family protein [candidate division WOR-3 bacterium]MDW7987146.1 MotA/TolQ/ExbB proton channel family protein [candidate division WOR-3 bacterium]